MATIDSTVGGTASNSYVSVAFANAYWADHYNATLSAQWDALSDGQKSSALIAACRVIETLRFTMQVTRADYTLRFNRLTGTVIDMSYLWREPVKFYQYQKLQFPRNLDVLPDTGALYIPPPITEAQCEQAIYLLNFDQTAMSNRLQGITMDKISVGRGQIDLTQEYASSGSSIGPMALEMVRPFLVMRNRVRRG
jgi:hypothetical protein